MNPITTFVPVATGLDTLVIICGIVASIAVTFILKVGKKMGLGAHVKAGFMS